MTHRRREQRDRRTDEEGDLRRRGDRDLRAEPGLPRRATTTAPALFGGVADQRDDHHRDEERREVSARPKLCSESTSSSETTAVAPALSASTSDRAA